MLRSRTPRRAHGSSEWPIGVTLAEDVPQGRWRHDAVWDREGQALCLTRLVVRILTKNDGTDGIGGSKHKGVEDELRGGVDCHPRTLALEEASER